MLSGGLFVHSCAPTQIPGRGLAHCSRGITRPNIDVSPLRRRQSRHNSLAAAAARDGEAFDEPVLRRKRSDGRCALRECANARMPSKE